MYPQLVPSKGTAVNNKVTEYATAAVAFSNSFQMPKGTTCPQSCHSQRQLRLSSSISASVRHCSVCPSACLWSHSLSWRTHKLSLMKLVCVRWSVERRVMFYVPLNCLAFRICCKVSCGYSTYSSQVGPLNCIEL